MDPLSQLAARAQERGGVRLYRKNVEKALTALRSTEDFWTFVDRADLPVPAAAAIVEVLREDGYLAVEEDRLRWTPAGLTWLETQNVPPYTSHLCLACEGRGIPFTADKDLYREFLRVSVGRPPAIQDFDQGSVTPETTVSRVLLLEQNGDLWGKDILVLGAEDDLTGLAIALTRKARRVLVLDIDARLVEFDNRAFRELGIDNAEARVFDLRNPLPDELLGAFDVFVSDPPETLASFRAFIGRGIAALREEGAVGYFGLTLRDASVYKWREFQRLLTGEFGVVITDILQNFNHYMNWDYHPYTRAAQIAPVAAPPRDIWYRSAWYRIEVLPGFVRWNEPIDDDVFYLDEEGTTT